MDLRRTKKQWRQYDTNAAATLSDDAIKRHLRDAKADILELHRRVALMYASLISIGEHHEEQRELWATECNADADQARYHKERSDFVKIAIAAALPEPAKCPG